MIKDLVEYQDYRAWYVAQQSVTMEDMANLSEMAERAELAREFGKKVFGLTDKQMNDRKFGIAGQLSEYAAESISLTDTRVDDNGIRRYSIRKPRTKPKRHAKGKKKGQFMERSLDGEFERRNSGLPGRGYRDTGTGPKFRNRGEVTPRLQGLLEQQRRITGRKQITDRQGNKVRMNPRKPEASIDALDFHRAERGGRRGRVAGPEPGRTEAGARMSQRALGTTRGADRVSAAAESLRQPVKQAARVKKVKGATKPKTPKRAG
jgi:hypothetical protein